MGNPNRNPNRNPDETLNENFDETKKDKPEKKRRGNLRKRITIYGPLLLLTLLVLLPRIYNWDQTQEVEFSEALNQIQTYESAGHQTPEEETAGDAEAAEAAQPVITSIRLYSRELVMEVDFDGKADIYTTYPRDFEERLVDILLEREFNWEVIARTPGAWTNLIGILPALLIVGLLGWLLFGQGLVGRAGRSLGVRPTERFEDVQGVEEAVESVREIVGFLKDPTPFERMGAKTPKGVLLVGPPGTGKTLLARAIAGEAEVPFFVSSGSEFSDMFVGAGSKKVRKLFKEARKSGPAIVFIDEIDSIGRKRSESPDSGGSSAVLREQDSILTTLLTELDGFEKSNVIVIGATNLPDALDPALLRRLHRRVEVPLPDIKGREEILKLHAKGRPFSENVNWKNVAKHTTGFSGADLELVVDEACLLASKQPEAKEVVESDLLNAAIGLHMGVERKSAVLTKFDREVTAWHEAGHAIVGFGIKDATPPNYVTIIPRGESGGHTRFDNSENKFITKSEVLARIAISMGGRAAEMIAYGPNGFTQGAGSDISVATDLATSYVTQYGMGSRLSKVDKETTRVGTNVGAKVDEEVESILREGLNLATKILKVNSTQLELLKNSLLEKETLEGDELDFVSNVIKFNVIGENK